MVDKDSPKDIACESFPCFKRNNYFYGKLLKAEDFQAEQQYFINKQRLVNRLVHGVGVMCGLQVLMKGPEAKNLLKSQIRITEGVAIDSCGREIVIPRFVDLDLSDHLKNGAEKQLLYVWVRYDYCGEEKTPTIMQDANCQESWNYSRIREGYAIGVGSHLPDTRETNAQSACARRNDSTENPPKNEILLKKCSDIFENEALVLAKITLRRKGRSISVDKVDNLPQTKGVIHRQIVYSNAHLFNALTCLRKRIDELEISAESLKKERRPKKKKPVSPSPKAV